MSACEGCWADANRRAAASDKSVVEEYDRLLEERKDNPCTPREEAGQWWDEERQLDTRDDVAVLEADPNVGGDWVNGFSVKSPEAEPHPDGPFEMYEGEG